MQKAFGKTTIKKEKDEVLEGYAYTFIYKGFETYFNEKNWEATQITNADYRVLLNGITYKVGDHISKLKKQFPISYRDRDRSFVSISITYKKEVVDTAISFDYDSKGIITKIIIANDNS